MFKIPGVQRKKRKEIFADYYKILGTTAKAGPEKIKEKYIEKVKEFPPETNPEEFQRIREAYDILKDPVKRRRYDVFRKFGPKIERQMEQVLFYAKLQMFEEARRILDNVIEIDSDNFNYFLIKAELFLVEDDIEGFNTCYDKALKLAPGDLYEDIEAVKIQMLMEHDHHEYALKELDHRKREFPDQSPSLGKFYMQIYWDLEDFNNFRMAAAIYAPSASESVFEDFDLFLHWLVAAVELGKTDEQQKVSSRIRKLIPLAENEEDLRWAIGLVMDEYYGYKEVVRFADAAVFIDLACSIDTKDKELARQKKEFIPLASLDSAITRLMNDAEIIPYVQITAEKLFYEKYGEKVFPEIYEAYNNAKSEMEHMDEYIAYGIGRLKKKYIPVYNAFKKEWEEMYVKHAAGLNREERRRLR